MNLKPLLDNVLVRYEEQKKQTESGIVFANPEKSDTETVWGTVLEVGPGVWNSGHRTIPSVVVGDRVLFPRYKGRVLSHDKTLVILKDEDLLATG